MKYLFSFLILFSFINSFSQNTKKVLWIGNSYTFISDIPNITKSLADAAGDDLIVDKSAFGSYTLELHYNNPTTISKIKENNWDHIILQEQSLRPAYGYLKFYNGVDLLTELINSLNPCLNKSILYMTWGRKENWNYPYLHMQELTTNAYNKVAEIFDTEVAPIGVAWKNVIQERGDINLYLPDQSHQSFAGAYLAACVFYATIFDKSPVGISYHGELSNDIATYLQEKAYSAYKEYENNKLIHSNNSLDYLVDVLRIRNEDSETILQNKIDNNNLNTNLDIVYEGIANNNFIDCNLKIEYVQNENTISTTEIPVSINLTSTSCNLISKKIDIDLNLNSINNGVFGIKVYLNNNIVKEYNLEKKSSLSISNFNKNNIDIYPSPTDKILNIKLPKIHSFTHGCIFSLNGKELDRFNLKNKKITYRNIKHLNSGLYFIKLYSNEQIITQKIIKS
ncbi:MAG: DUF4886 domain-containing protein [Flavobacteriaceae bacterium]